MNRYTLNVYDDDFEIIKTLEAPGIRWGMLVDIFERLTSDEDPTNDVSAVEEIMLSIFPKATREDLRGCLLEDMVAVVNQAMSLAARNGLVQAKATKGKAKGKN